MDYHITPGEMDLARELASMGFRWKCQLGDYFCTPDGQFHICIDISREGGRVMVKDAGQNSFEADKVAWIPRKLQCVAWLTDRGWKVRESAGEKSSSVQLINMRGGAIPTLDGYGRTELEAMFAGMAQVLDAEEEKRGHGARP